MESKISFWTCSFQIHMFHMLSHTLLCVILRGSRCCWLIILILVIMPSKSLGFLSSLCKVVRLWLGSKHSVIPIPTVVVGVWISVLHPPPFSVGSINPETTYSYHRTLHSACFGALSVRSFLVLIYCRFGNDGTCLVSLLDWVRGVKCPLIRSHPYSCTWLGTYWKRCPGLEVVLIPQYFKEQQL